MPAVYAELHAVSNFSFLDGASHPEELAARGAELGLAALALTDRNGLYGAVRFAKAARGTSLGAICGAELTLDAPQPAPRRRAPSARELEARPRVVLLAADAAGYANLASAISAAQLRGAKRDARLRLEDLAGRTQGLVALSGSRHGHAEEALLRGDAAAARERCATLRDLFPGAFYLELQHHLRAEDARLIGAQVELGAALAVPCVATNGAAYAAPQDAMLADVLACIRHRTTLQGAGELLRPNAEFYLKSPEQMTRIFAPYPHAIAATLEIAERCTFRLEKLAGQFPRFPIPPGETSTHGYLRTLVARGAAERYGTPLPANVERQLEYELGIIARMELAGYFLVVWDITRAARELGVLGQGRGSAANSAVCYALGITAVDPIGMNLLFERFLSEERNEIPDIDIDFAHRDRERVIQYVYDRYDREHAAMTAEVITFRTRSAVRDVGKALGLSLAQVDAIAVEYDARESLAGAVGADYDGRSNLPESVQNRRDLDAGTNQRRSRADDQPALPKGGPGHVPGIGTARDDDGTQSYGIEPSSSERSDASRKNATRGGEGRGLGAGAPTAPRSHGWREGSGGAAGEPPGRRLDERPRPEPAPLPAGRRSGAAAGSPPGRRLDERPRPEPAPLPAGRRSGAAAGSPPGRRLDERPRPEPAPLPADPDAADTERETAWEANADRKRSAIRGDERNKPWAFYGFKGKDFGPDPDPHVRGAIGGATGALLLALCRRLDGFPRHMGIHSGGMMITRDPLVRVAPVEWATMRDRTIVQWDKDDIADLGLIKIDLLGLGMLSLLREAFALHAKHHGSPQPPLSLATIPPDDGATYAMLQRADSIGTFQVESRAQMSMLPRLKPACFYDLVMQVAIIRPGPIQGDMIHPFLRRRNGLEPVTYPHPKLEPILSRTLGVPLFQEQGMRMAIEAAGFSPGQADQLRRAMGHKRSRERMAEIFPKLVDGMVANGIDREAAVKLFHMLEGFADYGFPESHAASFALLSYASSYVKCHHPAIFLAAILNVQPMGFYSTEVLVNDARRHDVVVRPVAVNASAFWSGVEPDGATRLGFHVVRGLGEAQRERLDAALGGEPFADLDAFAARTGLAREALENLAIAGAFAPWFATRREAMWALRGLGERAARGELARGMDVPEPAPRLRALSPREETALDIWGTGLTTGPQPVAHVRARLDALGALPAHRLGSMRSGLRCTVGGMVITRQRPGTAKGFVFLTLEDETGLVNVIVDPATYERNRRLVRASTCLVVDGVLQRDRGTIDVLAEGFRALDLGDVVTGVHARNFR